LIVDTIGQALAQLLIYKVVNADSFRSALRLVFPAFVGEITDRIRSGCANFILAIMTAHDIPCHYGNPGCVTI
jgi:hypothetical protein